MAITYDEATRNYTDGATTWSPNSNGVYEIGNLDQLKFFRDAVNDGNSFNGQTVKLTDSIDLNNEEWTPIGKSGKTFQGTFDGQGNTVSNLKITRGTSNVAANCGIGFFGYTNSPATITNLTINNVDITGSLYVGAIVGYGYTGKEISNCHVTGQIEIEGWWYIGGIGGNGYVSKVSGCSVVGNEDSYIKAVSYDNEVGSYVGGIWGFRGEGNNTIADCSVNNIDISGMDRIGGICGIAHYANTIEECSISNSSITADNNIGNVGLIAGANLGNATNGPAILLNNTVDVTTKENFTLEGQVIENPPVLGANINTGAPAQAAIIGDVTRNEAGEIVDGTISVVGTEKDSIDVSSKLDLADGLAFYPNSDGTISVDEAGYVAAIGDTRYTSFENAQAAVKPGETITILTDITEETVSMTGFGIASWNNSTFTTTKKLAVDAGANVLSGNVESAQLMLTGSKEENRTLTITESANVDLDTDGALDGGLLDVGKGLSDDKLVIIGDTGPRNYYAHVLVAGDVSVKRNKSDGNAEYGAIYIRPYSELVVTGKLDVVGEVHNRGSLVVDGGTMTMSKWLTPKLLGYDTGDSMTVTNGGRMEIYDAGAVTFGEASASLQHMDVVAQYNDGMFATISAGGQFVADTLAFANDEDVTLTVTGEGSTFTLYSADGRTVAGGYTYAQNEGEIIIEDNAVFDVSELANDNFVNTGTIDISSATATFATLTNDGTVNVTGAVNVDAEFMAAGTGLLNLNSVAFGSGTSVNDTASYTNNTIGSEIVMTGTNTLTDGAFVSTGWDKNFRLGYNTGTENDSLEITGGATLKVGGNSYIGSAPEDKGASAYQVTVSGAGSSFAGSGAGGELYLRGDGRLTVKDDASASFSYADIKGSVILENGNFSFIDSRLFGTITMDYASTLAFETITAADDSLTIDMNGFSGGLYKLLDYTGSDSYTLEQYKALIGEENWNENFTVVDNDLFAANVDTSVLKVNSAWIGTAAGSVVEDGFYYGFNAFGDMNTAVSSIDRSYVLGDTFKEPITIKMTDATSGTLDLYGMNLVLTGNLTSSGSWNLALVPVASSGTDPNYITYLKLDNAQIEMTGDAALEGVNYGKAAVSFEKDGNIIASADQNIQRGAIVELVNGTVFDADNQVNGRGVFFKIDGASRITQYGTGNSLITMTSGAIVDGGQSTAGDYTSINQLDANDIYFGRGSSQWAGIYGDKTYFTFRNGANVEAKDCIEFGTGSLLKEMDVEIEASKIVATNNMIIGTENNAGKITSFVVSNNSLLQAGTDLSIVGTTVELSNSMLNAATVTLTDGKLNVSGTSAITAEVSGDLDIVDGAAVTFGAGSTSDDLRIASGAEVTLRGSLSSGNIYGVDETGTHEYNDGSNGITVNVATGDGETFKSYAWYASNGSTYNVMAGSNVELTYANINATGTVNVAEGATLTTVMESSNIVGTLNVDGTANGVMTVYAGYTGGHFTDGAQAGEVNINGTGTVNTSIMTIGTGVRDDDKYNAAATEDSNNTASVVVNGGTLNATGFEGELTSKLFVGSDDFEGVLTGKNGAKINVGERSANGTGYMRFLIGENGTLNLDNSTMTVYNLGGRNNSANGVFQNSGTINMDLDSQIVTATALKNSGTITVDMAGAAEFGVYKLIDYTGSDETAYGNVKFTNNGYEYTASVFDNDLYLVREDGAKKLYVNSAWQSAAAYEEVTFVDETTAYYGLNAFDTVDNAVKSLSANDPILLNVTGGVEAITVVGTSVTEVNASAKDQIDPETGTVAADAIVVNLVEIDNTNAGWQVYYPLASGSNAQVYGNITTNFLSTTFTYEGERTGDPNFSGAGYAGTTATVYGNTTVNIGKVDADDTELKLNTGFLLGAGGGTVNGSSSLNINSGTIEAGAVVGGGAWGGLVKGDSSVTISGGEITLGTSTYNAVYGGSYGYANPTSAETRGSASVTIKGDAVVNGKVIGGSDQTAVTGTTVEISGEAQVNGNVYAGGNRGGQVTGNTSVTLTGGTVTGNVYGGGDNSSVIGDTSVVVNGADVEAGIYGGSLNGDAGDTTVTISNFTRLQPVPGTQSDKIQIVGGGMAEAGKSSTTASTNVTVTDSKIYGDVVAGSSATGTGATAISGKSVVNVSNLEINGYSEGSNIWTGRVFGAGRAQYGGSVVTESTDVTIENMSGYTYDSEGNIIDGSNKGARVYGAGQAYASMSRVEVGETKLRISGDATNISEIYGGGIVSGTEVQEKAAFQIVGKTDVEITGGTVTDVIAGGNNTNWFGRTVIGVDAGDGTYQAAEGEYGIRLVIGGSTKVNEGALVTGGSYVDFAYEYQNIVDGVDTYGRTAEIYGNTYMELTGDSVISTDVFGGSFTCYEQVDLTADVSKLSAPSATQYGDVTVVVSGNTAIAGSVYGGGAVLTNTDQVKTTSVTNGDVSVLISGGTIGGNVYAGGYYADVNGNASVTLSGGTVGGDIYGGSKGSGTVAGSSTLNVGATDAARYTTTLNNVYDFDVATVVNADVTVEEVFSATQISIADSTLTLNSGFDAATTTVSIEVGAYNAETAALVLGSAVGTAPAISISAGSNALTEARYLVATGFDDTTAFSLDESLAGDYLLRAVDGNIYLYNADAPYFTTELSVTQAEGASVDGYYSFTANFEAAGLLTGYTLKLYDSATATTPVDEVTLDADVIGQEFTLENTTQSFWISVTANGENGLSTDSPTSGRLEVVVKDYDSPVIQSVSSNVASDAITLTCEATDNFGVTGYEFILDGQSLGVQTGSEIALDLSTLTAGTHSYTVNVYDAAGNLATSAEQSFDFTPEPGPGPEPGPTEPANFLYSSQVRMDNGETVSVYATYSDAAAALEYRIGDSGEWLTYDATTGVNVSSSTTVYFREQGITDPVETAVDVTVVPADVELNAEVILLAPTTDTTYEVIYNFADGGSKAVELSGNSVEHYALPENTTVTVVEKDASGEIVNTIVEETPAASTTAEIPDKVVAVDDGHDNLFFAMPVGKWTGNRAQHQGDGVWGGTLEVVSLTGKNRFSTVFTGSDDATTLFLTDDANGDAFFLDDIYTANGSDARIRKMSEIQAGAGDDIVDLTSVRYAYEEHASKQLTIRGGDGNDILWGNAGHNIMFGDDGNDKIYGGSDNDVLIGGTGNDTMLGGGGDDIFCYGSSFDWGSDTITQLSGGTVTLYLDGIDRNDCSISGSTLTWNDGTHTGSITLNGVSWDSVKFYCAANGDGDLTKQSDYEELKNKGAFAAISSH